MEYWVYILQSESTGRYYVGQTHNLADRLVCHNSEKTGAEGPLTPADEPPSSHR